MGEDSPNRVLWNMICANAFQDHPYGLPIIGTPKSVKSFQRKDLQSFYNKWYQPKNIKLIVVGGGETDELKNKINQTFGSLRAKNINTVKLNDNFNSMIDKLKKQQEKCIHMERKINSQKTKKLQLNY